MRQRRGDRDSLGTSETLEGSRSWKLNFSLLQASCYLCCRYLSRAQDSRKLGGKLWGLKVAPLNWLDDFSSCSPRPQSRESARPRTARRDTQEALRVESRRAAPLELVYIVNPRSLELLWTDPSSNNYAQKYKRSSIWWPQRPELCEFQWKPEVEQQLRDYWEVLASFLLVYLVRLAQLALASFGKKFGAKFNIN